MRKVELTRKADLEAKLLLLKDIKRGLIVSTLFQSLTIGGVAMILDEPSSAGKIIIGGAMILGGVGNGVARLKEVYDNVSNYLITGPVQYIQSNHYELELYHPQDSPDLFSIRKASFAE